MYKKCNKLIYTKRRNAKTFKRGKWVFKEGYLTFEECQKILETLPNEKSPGEDGFTAEFYKHFFDLVGYDLVEGLNAAYEIACQFRSAEV